VNRRGAKTTGGSGRGRPGVARLGALLAGTGLGHRARGLQRARYGVDYFPHDHARSRAYRWNDDGLAGFCDERQTFCFGLSLWNGKDAILKERIFGLAGPRATTRGCQGVLVVPGLHPDALVDAGGAITTRRAVPVRRSGAANGARGRRNRSSNWSIPASSTRVGSGPVEVDYAKAGPTDVCITIRATNTAPEAATLHLLPTLGSATRGPGGCPGFDDVPTIHGYDEGTLVRQAPHHGPLVLAGEGSPEALVCDNESNAERLWGWATGRRTQGRIGDHVVEGKSTVNPTGSVRRRRCTTQWTLRPARRGAALRLALWADRPTSGRRSRPRPATPGSISGPGSRRSPRPRHAEADGVLSPS